MYYNTETGQDDFTELQVRTLPEYDTVSFGPDDFPPAPWVAVVEAAAPSFDSLRQDVQRGLPALVDGAWVRQWSVVDVAPEVAAARIANAKAQMWERIKTERDRRKLDGGYTAAGKWFHSDTFSRTQQIGLVMLGASIPANTPWKTMSGEFVTMTQTLAGQIFAAAAAQDMATFHAAEVHRVAMEGSTDPLAYSFATGWPAIYGD